MEKSKTTTPAKSKPVAVRRAISFIGYSLLLEMFAFIVLLVFDGSRSLAIAALVSVIISIAVLSFLAYKMWQGKNWAYLAFATFFFVLAHFLSDQSLLSG